MTLLNVNLLWLLLGVDRLGFGGGIRSGLRTICTVIAVLIAVGARGLGRPWQFAAVDAIGLLILLTLPHGPMLSPDQADIKDDRFDPVYSVTRWIKNVDARWGIYSAVRYPGIAAIWTTALELLGDPAYLAPFVGSFWIPVFYRLLWPSRASLPQFARPGDQVENWDELVGWTLMGATICVWRMIA